MNYNDPSFWLLFAAVYAFYWRLGHRGQNRLLLVASYAFYGFWDFRFLYLILISTAIDFIGGLGVAGVRLSRARQARVLLVLVAGALLLGTKVRYAELWRGLWLLDVPLVTGALPRRLGDFAIPLATVAASLAYAAVLPRLYAAPERRRRRTFLAISMVANLAILGFFKYCDFFITSFVDLLAVLGLRADVRTLGIVLPPAISFYTFQAMSYTIDIYRGEAEPTGDLADFALFVCFFPHLVAGPIMRASNFLPQVVQPRRRRPSDLEEGTLLVVLGLFKKIVVADNLAPIANTVFFQFDDPAAAGPTGPEALVGLYAFAFQIYCDFSGYSSVARGIAKWLGFELVINFRTPYLAVSPSDFWRRWHISLSTWLRDYLYIPLGGNRGGMRREYRNLMLTMVLGGLWHGASWTFVIWGLYHGLILCAFRLAGVRDPAGGPRRLLRIVVMFHLACLGWLFFRASTLTAAGAMLARILGDATLTPMAITMAGLVAFYAGPLFLLEAFTAGEERLDRLLRAPWPRQSLAYGYLVLMLVLFPAAKTVEFIYFQF
jgi:D-alanyl-lipoteichoic acid acyltransferase DltB (MBOAT superfamily)